MVAVAAAWLWCLQLQHGCGACSHGMAVVLAAMGWLQPWRCWLWWPRGGGCGVAGCDQWYHHLLAKGHTQPKPQEQFVDNLTQQVKQWHMQQYSPTMS